MPSLLVDCSLLSDGVITWLMTVAEMSILNMAMLDPQVMARTVLTRVLPGPPGAAWDWAEQEAGEAGSLTR